MITVTIWHNVSDDEQDGHHAMLDGYRPGDPVVRVFTYQADPAGSPEAVAEDAFAICNGHPRRAADAGLSRDYYDRELRSLSVGDVVTVTADGEARLAVARTGWALIPGPLAEVRTSQYGTRPLPPAGEPAPEPRQENHGD